METNELLEIWKELRRDDFAYLHLFPFEELRYIVPRLIWQLKAKMDYMIYRIEQLKAMISFASAIKEQHEKNIKKLRKDNALLHQRLKKCQEEREKLDYQIEGDLFYLRDQFFVSMYNHFLQYLDNPTQKITITKEYCDNVFRDFRNYEFDKIYKKYKKGEKRGVS